MTKLTLYGLLACCFCKPLLADDSTRLIGTLTAAEQVEMLNAHNSWRQGVGVKPLAWSITLSKSAQSYANQLSQSGCKMQHSQTNHGENLYWASPLTRKYPSGKTSTQAQNITPTHVAARWASEAKDYTHSSNSCRKDAVCGHYTQMVWHSTRQLGCGRAFCTDKAQLWVCHYDPAGNFINQKPY